MSNKQSKCNKEFMTLVNKYGYLTVTQSFLDLVKESYDQSCHSDEKDKVNNKAINLLKTLQEIMEDEGYGY